MQPGFRLVVGEAAPFVLAGATEDYEALDL